MKNQFSAFCIAGTQSGTGKTTVALALLSALARRGLRVRPFKCGPDYIDPSFHAQAAGAESINLDTWMMSAPEVRASFRRNCRGFEVAVVEGVMGLFDGAAANSLLGSTASCAMLLGLPVVLVVDATGLAGSIAALVAGFANFSARTKLAGVVANNVGSESHSQILAESLAKNHLPPLIGSLPRHVAWTLPERHLGLIPFGEKPKSIKWFETLAAAAEKHLAIDQLLAITRTKRPAVRAARIPPASSRIAVARDEAFSFYYPDNFHHLRMAGFEIVEFSPLRDSNLPENVDFIYLGGGFPEMFARQLAANHQIRKAIKAFAKSGGRIYAECGGMMYLCRYLRDPHGRKIPLCGVIPATTFMGAKLRSLGYREAEVMHDLPFCRKGTVVKGHEFHWSDMVLDHPMDPLHAIRDSRGRQSVSGIVMGSVAASYVHLHFGSNPTAIINRAR